MSNRASAHLLAGIVVPSRRCRQDRLSTLEDQS